MSRADRYALLLLVILSACAPAVSPQPRPTPLILSAQDTSALQTLRPFFDDCMKNQPGVGWIVEEMPASALDYHAITLRWGAHGLEERIASGDLIAYELGQEELVIVTHPSNPLEQITSAELRALYTGGQTSPGLQPRTVPASEDIAMIFSEQILSGAIANPNLTWLVPDLSAMREAIAGDPQAIGYLPRRWVDETVRPVEITGVEQAALREPILAVRSGDLLAGEEQQFLLCLQDLLK